MASWVTYKGLQVPDVSTGDAGINLTANLKLLADNFEALNAANVTTGTLPVTRGGTGTGTAFTQDRIVFAGASGVYSQDANFVYSASSGRLGIGTSSPSYPIDIRVAANAGEFGLYFLDTYNGSGGGSRAGFRSGFSVTSASDVSTALAGLWQSTEIAASTSANFVLLYGILFEAFHRGSGTLTTLTGIRGLAQQNTGSGTITNRIAISAAVASQASTTTTNTYGVQLVVSESGTVTNHYGFYSPDSPATNDWGVYALNDQNYFSGKVGIGVAAPTAKLDVNSDILRLRTAKTPASATAAGNQGDIAWDANYMYVCVATNTWKRTALSTW